MGCFYTPNLPYDLNTFLDNLPVYTLGDEGSATLEQCREIVESGEYYFQGIPFPKSIDCSINGNQTFSGNISIPPLSYILAVTGDSFLFGEGQSPTNVRNLEGFTIRLYDKGAKMDTVVAALYAQNLPNIGCMADLAPVVNPHTPQDLQTDRPIGPLFLPSPMVVLAPGSLQIDVTNLNTVKAYIQIMFMVAVPISAKSTSEVVIAQGTNSGGRFSN